VIPPQLHFVRAAQTNGRVQLEHVVAAPIELRAGDRLRALPLLGRLVLLIDHAPADRPAAATPGPSASHTGAGAKDCLHD
jgi:hypothetical protein